MEAKDLILKIIKEKSVLKQNVSSNTMVSFQMLKEVLKELIQSLQEGFGNTDKRVQFYYKEKGKFEAEIKIAGDILIFHMHTNVFQFDRSNSLWQSSYLRDNENNGYVGVINVYNFLSDSFKYQRSHDLGYLIARIFINQENHFQVQGKRQLGYLYNDFINAIIDRDKICDIVESAILYALDFDLLAPPYQSQQELSVGEMLAVSDHLNVATGKRLGFKFSATDSGIE